MDTYADDLAELMEFLDLHDTVLVVHSTGGVVARYMERHGSFTEIELTRPCGLNLRPFRATAIMRRTPRKLIVFTCPVTEHCFCLDLKVRLRLA